MDNIYDAATEFPTEVQKVVMNINPATLFNEPSLEFRGEFLDGYSSNESDEEFQPMQHRPSFGSYPSKSESKNSLYIKIRNLLCSKKISSPYCLLYFFPQFSLQKKLNKLEEVKMN